MSKQHIIEITPELHRRVNEERRRSVREHTARLERRLAEIAFLMDDASANGLDHAKWETIYRLAKGIE